MSNPPNNQAQQANTEDRQAQISDYLQAPRRKRKNYVITALGPSFVPEIKRKIEGFIRTNFPNLALGQPDDLGALRRQFGRNINLLIVNHDFCENEDELFASLKNLKEKRRKDRIPLLFLTRKPNHLIKRYHEELLPYQELDDYAPYETCSIQTILSRVRDGIDVRDKRGSRRFNLNQDITYFSLNQDRTIPGKIVDISLHGAKIISSEDSLFKNNEQLILRIPTQNYFKHTEGDFLKLSAIVRRVFIAGNQAGISFEHLNERQSEKLAKLVMAVGTRNLKIQTQNIKAAYEAEKSKDI